MPCGHLMRIPWRQRMPNRLLADLVFRHRRDDLVVDQQPINIESFVARRVGRLELHRTAAFRILNAGEQRSLEQFRLVFELFHGNPLAGARTLQVPIRAWTPPARQRYRAAASDADAGAREWRPAADRSRSSPCTLSHEPSRAPSFARPVAWQPN